LITAAFISFQHSMTTTLVQKSITEAYRFLPIFSMADVPTIPPPTSANTSTEQSSANTSTEQSSTNAPTHRSSPNTPATSNQQSLANAPTAIMYPAQGNPTAQGNPPTQGNPQAQGSPPAQANPQAAANPPAAVNAPDPADDLFANDPPLHGQASNTGTAHLATAEQIAERLEHWETTARDFAFRLRQIENVFYHMVRVSPAQMN
jgi:hypothetical protein